METALRVLHSTLVTVLVTAHGAFLLRGFAIEAGRINPGKLDHLARSLSQAMLPVAVLSGLILRLTALGADGASAAGPHPLPVLHLLLGLAPLAAIPLVFFGRVILKRRRQASWLLPTINLLLLAAAVVTGIMLWR